jgi:hypothetical protein
MAKISASTNIDNIQIQEQGSAPSTPSSGYGRIYCKSDGVYFIGDNGVEIGPLAAAAAGYTQGARAYNNADQNSTSGAVLTVALNSELYDTDTIHDNSSNNSRLTCKTAGKYLIIANLTFAVHVTGVRYIDIYFGGATVLASLRILPNGSQDDDLCVSTIYSLAENEYVELRAYQNSTATVAVKYYGNNSPMFMMQRIG